MIIREATLDDVDYIMKSGSNEQGFEASSSVEGFWSKDQIINIINSNDILLVAESNKSEVSGFIICLLNKTVGKSTIENVFVDKKFRGEGVGSILIDKVLEESNKKGCNYICGLVEENNKSSIKLFNKAGFNKGYKFYWMDKKI